MYSAKLLLLRQCHGVLVRGNLGGSGTLLLIFGVIVGLLILVLGGLFAKKIRIVSTWTCGEKQPNEQMIVPGTHFYKTVSSMNILKQLYAGQEKGHFDPYDHTGKIGLAVTQYLRWLHSGLLPVYLTWVTLGLLIVILVLCGIQ